MTVSVVATHRGRPRSEVADRAIVAAALDVLIEVGAARFSVEAVAARAGVGKSTIYRRFDGAHDLLARALSTLNDDLPPTPAGVPVREALISIVEGIRERSAEGRSDRCLPQVLSQAHLNPELFEIYYERVVLVRRERVRAVLRDAVTRGEVRDDVDLDLLVSLFTAPMIGLMMMTPLSRRRVDDSTAASIVDAVLSGVGVH